MKPSAVVFMVSYSQLLDTAENIKTQTTGVILHSKPISEVVEAILSISLDYVNLHLKL